MNERFRPIREVQPQDRAAHVERLNAKHATEQATRKEFLQNGPMIELHIRAADDLECWTKRRAYSVPSVGDSVVFISDADQTLVDGSVLSVRWRYVEDEITVATVIVGSDNGAV